MYSTGQAVWLSKTQEQIGGRSRANQHHLSRAKGNGKQPWDDRQAVRAHKRASEGHNIIISSYIVHRVDK